MWKTPIYILTAKTIKFHKNDIYPNYNLDRLLYLPRRNLDRLLLRL